METLIAQAKRLESGRRMFIRIIIAILLITVWVMIWYQIQVEGIDFPRLLQQLVRLVLVLTLIYFTWKGKLWGKVALAFMLLIGALASMVGWLDNPGDWTPKAPLIAMAFIYGFGFYFILFSKNFNLFFNSLQKRTKIS